MKKLVLSLSILVITFSVKAQDDKKITFGAQASILSSTASYSVVDNTGTSPATTASSIIGFRVGGFVNIAFNDNISFAPGINFLSKGAKVTETSSLYTGDVTIHGSYLELPLNFYYTGLKGFKFVLGPVLSYGIGGSYTANITDYTGASQSKSGDVKFDGKGDAGDNNVHLKAFELGANLIAGYNITPHISASLLYNTSFTNTYANQTGYSDSYKTSYFGLSVGYEF